MEGDMMQKMACVRPFGRRVWVLSLSVVGWGGCVDSGLQDESSIVMQQTASAVPDGGVAATGVHGDTLDPAAESKPVIPFAHSGTRLKARHYVASGVAQFQTFYDDALKTECEWAVTGPGEMRCLPSRRADILFADAACTQPVVGSYASIPVIAGDGVPQSPMQEGSWVRVESAQDAKMHCLPDLPRASAVYRVGEVVDKGSSSDVSRYIDLGDKGRGCEKVYSGGESRFSQRADPVSQDLFAYGKLVSVDAGGGLTAHRVIGSDGSEATVGVSDAKDTYCQILADGLCVPGRSILKTTRTGEPHPFYDEECTLRGLSREAPTAARTCGPPMFGIDNSSGSSRVYKLKATGTKNLVLCENPFPSETNDIDYYYYRDPNAYDADTEVTATFPKARLMHFGTGSLSREQFVSERSDVVMPLAPGGGFIDAQGGPCRVLLAADGTFRCFPDRWNLTALVAFDDRPVMFGDADCTRMLFLSPDGMDISKILVKNDRRPKDGKADTSPDSKKLVTLSTVKVHDGNYYYYYYPDEGGPACAPVSPPTAVTKRSLIGDQDVPFSVLPLITLADL